MNLSTDSIYVIIPALNEAENLRWLLPRLTSRYFVTVVDNGSTDETAAVAASHGASVISCEKRGYGIAVQSGINQVLKHASPGSVLVILDADGSSPLELIEPLTMPILSSSKDLVIAQRRYLAKDSMPPHAQFGNWLQVSLINLFCGYRYSDMGPMRALSISAYKRLSMRDKTWGWNVEMQIKALFHSLRILEIDSSYGPRKYGESKISGNLLGSLRAGTKILYSVVFYFMDAYLSSRRLLKVKPQIAQI